MIGYGLRECAGDTIECFVPARIAAADLRIKQSSISGERVAERRALRAEPAAIGGVVRVSRDRTVRRDAQATTDAAIGTGGSEHAACHCGLATAGTAAAVPAPSACAGAALACSAKARPKTI